MIHDYKRKGNPIFSCIQNISVDEETQMITEIGIALAFYSNPYLGVEKAEKLKAKLTKTSKKDFLGNSRQENIYSVSVGDYVELQYDWETESYIVSSETGEELGETSASVTQKLQGFSPDCEFIGRIQSIDENDSGKYTVEIEIFLRAM